MLTYADFEPGRRIEHAMSRTLFASESALFSAMFHHHNPLYLDERRARERGHPHLVVNPFYLFNLVLGITVPDLTERGGPFLGAEGIDFVRPVHAGESIGARSVVVSRRESGSRPGWGIVTWTTEGVALGDPDEVVLRYTRSNLVPLEPQA